MEELDLKELLQIFGEKKLQIILIIAIFVVIGIIYTMAFITPKYESLTTLLLATNSSSDNDSSITTTDVTLNSKLVGTYSDLVKSDKIVGKVISNLAIDATETSIKNNVTVSARTGSDIIEIKVKNENPELAAKIANELAKVFIEDAVKEYYGIENVHVVDEAKATKDPCNINHSKDVIIFGAIGLVIAIMYVLVSNMLDTTVKSAQDIERVTGFTVLASIPLYELGEDKNKTKKKKGGKR